MNSKLIEARRGSAVNLTAEQKEIVSSFASRSAVTQQSISENMCLVYNEEKQASFVQGIGLNAVIMLPMEIVSVDENTKAVTESGMYVLMGASAFGICNTNNGGYIRPDYRVSNQSESVFTSLMDKAINEVAKTINKRVINIEYIETFTVLDATGNERLINGQPYVRKLIGAIYK